MKELRVGMIGYGFMGRAHSNAYKRLNDFFPVEHRPVLKAVCARNPDKAQQFADNWGYERVESTAAGRGPTVRFTQKLKKKIEAKPKPGSPGYKEDPYQ